VDFLAVVDDPQDDGVGRREIGEKRVAARLDQLGVPQTRRLAMTAAGTAKATT